MATGHERRLATEAARASVLTVHAAVGLAWQTDKDAARLLRAAEGLCRAAVAKLAASPVPPPGTVPPPGKAAEKNEEMKDKKSKRKRKKTKQNQEMQVDGGGPTPVATIGSLAGAVVGDLSELGISTGYLEIPSSSAAEVAPTSGTSSAAPSPSAGPSLVAKSNQKEEASGKNDMEEEGRLCSCGFVCPWCDFSLMVASASAVVGTPSGADGLAGRSSGSSAFGGLTRP